MITLLILLVVVGVILYIFNILIPMDPKFKTIINIIVGLVVFLYILQAFGLIGNFPFIPRWNK